MPRMTAPLPLSVVAARTPPSCASARTAAPRRALSRTHTRTRTHRYTTRARTHTDRQTDTSHGRARAPSNDDAPPPVECCMRARAPGGVASGRTAAVIQRHVTHASTPGHRAHRSSSESLSVAPRAAARTWRGMAGCRIRRRRRARGHPVPRRQRRQRAGARPRRRARRRRGRRRGRGHGARPGQRVQRPWRLRDRRERAGQAR